jgi:uncharacterized RDD family membrane protein YckC
LPANAPLGLCPACLVEAGLRGHSQDSLDVTAVGTGAAADELLDPALQPTCIGAEASGGAHESAGLPEAGELRGRYQIVRRLGRGGMGTVFEANETETGRRVALKLLTRVLDPAAKLRFLQEGRLAAAINHPHSVYVFGTEEIGSTPAISMELVRGGTLEDRVRREGPLPIGSAVDCILQIIDGLEAAQARGVLHRDIKPSNCFVDAGGRVKIGDFGLSISTDGRAESPAETGSFQGTPAFASPEQFRGDVLDVRSDIYSVGVTLFYLLTGKTPFQAPDLTSLTVAVLERPAPAIDELRPDIPRRLARAVQRCLAKSKFERFASYAELRRSLERFDSAAPHPATPLARIVAGLIDGFLLGVAGLLPYQARFGSSDDFEGHPTLKMISLYIPYIAAPLWFAIPEALWGASVGKSMCRLRVVGRDGQPPDFVRSVVRSGIVTLAPCLAALAITSTIGDVGSDQKWKLLAVNLMVFLPVLLFVTCRPANGWAGVHELATGTRTVARLERHSRPRGDADDETPAAMKSIRQIGPYAVLTLLERRQGKCLWLGFDGRLLRKVWILTSEPGAPRHCVYPEIGRSTRLRWLSGQESATGGWDAFESLPGQPLVNLLRRRQPWESVRYWLYDLAGELAAAGADGTLPDILDLDRVWISSDGRAKLMDFRAGGADAGYAPVERPSATNAESCRTFLLQVAMSALEGHAVAPAEAASRPVDALVPLHARIFLDGLSAASDLGTVAASLQPLMSRRATISRSRRFALVASCCLLPFAISANKVHLFTTHPNWIFPDFEVEVLRRCVERFSVLEHVEPLTTRQAAEKSALEAYVAWESSDYGSAISHATGEGSYARVFMTGEQYRLWQQIRGRYGKLPEPTPEMLSAPSTLESFFRDIRPIEPRDRLTSPFVPRYALFLLGVGYAIVIATTLTGALLFRGLAVHALGIALVNRRGHAASRTRILFRTLMVWSPLLLVGVLLPIPDHAVGVLVLLGLFCIAAAWSIVSPARGLADALAGTWLVPS